jgi:hypothetical protein
MATLYYTPTGVGAKDSKSDAYETFPAKLMIAFSRMFLSP